MPTVETSKRLGLLSTEQLQWALDRFGLGRLIEAQSIPFGLFGQNVFLTTSAGEFVLRGSPHFEWQFPTEQFFVDWLHEQADVPVPWPYEYDPSPEIFGWPYVLMPRMPGLQLADPVVVRLLSHEDRLDIARAMGQTLARLHDPMWPHAGRYDPQARAIQPFELLEELAWPFPPEPTSEPAVTISHHERAVASIRHHIALCRTYNDRTTAADAEWVEQLIASARPALAEPFPPCVVMADYKEANVVVQPESQGWQVSGVFDWMEAYVGDGEVDLSRQSAAYLDTDPELATAYLSAYCQRRPPRPGFRERFAVYMLLDRLSIWEYAQRHGRGLGDTAINLQTWAGPYTTGLTWLPL